MNLVLTRLIVAVLALTALSACNTIEGLGKDLRTAGEHIEDAAKKK